MITALTSNFPPGYHNHITQGASMTAISGIAFSKLLPEGICFSEVAEWWQDMDHSFCLFDLTLESFQCKHLWLICIHLKIHIKSEFLAFPDSAALISLAHLFSWQDPWPWVTAASCAWVRPSGHPVKFNFLHVLKFLDTLGHLHLAMLVWPVSV